MGCFKKILRLLRISKKTSGSEEKYGNYSENVVTPNNFLQDEVHEAGSTNEDIKTAGPSSPTPSIFKLTPECYDEIFEYLSVKDLHSFAVTCTRMNEVAGQYFQRNYKRCEKSIRYNGIYTEYSDHEGASNEFTQTSGFNRFIQNISFNNENLGPLHYIESKSHELQSVQSINFMSTCIDVNKMKHFAQILPQIESIRLHQCSGRGDVYDVLLKYCNNLKNLIIYDDLGNILNCYKRNEWLNQHYPKLEYLQLSPRRAIEIPDLYTFFETNANVQTFSTTSLFLWMNRGLLLKSNLKLNVLDVEFSKKFGSNLSSLGEFRDLFNELHEKGIFEHLHLTVDRVNQTFCDEIASLPAVEKLVLREFNGICSLHQLTGLKELVVPGGLKREDIEILANTLVNLEKVTIYSITSNDLLPFMHCAKLRELYAQLTDDACLHLTKLNEERGKVANAQKVTIYLNHSSFLATKWSIHNGDIDMKLTEIKRNSFEHIQSELK